MRPGIVIGVVILSALGLAAVTVGHAADEPRGNVTIVDIGIGAAFDEALALSDAEDYAGARERLRNALASGGLKEQEQSQLRYEMARLYVAEGLWSQGAAALEEWFATAPEPHAAANYLLAISYYQLGDYERALPLATKAVEATAQPPESWLQLVAAVQLRGEHYAAAIPWLERLIEVAPANKDYWLQLSSAYQHLEQYDRALAAMQLAYSAGLLTADAELHRLTDLLLYNGLPNRSAEILESVISERSGVDPSLDRKLGESWAAAGELDKAVAPLERVAAAAASGDAFVRLAELHVERRDWRAAIDALAHALKKGDLEDPARAALLTGVALFGMSHYAEAREWFARAAGTDVYRQTANDYIEAIDARVG